MTNGTAKIITRAQAKAALLRSGYLLESRVESVLRDYGYFTETNTSYPDPYTGKSRELDLSAITASQVGRDDFGFVFPVLLIECVNNQQPFALVTKESQVPFLYYEDVKISGLPAKVPVPGGRRWQSLQDYLGMDEWHHYSEAEHIATQFASFRIKKGRKDEWMALHEDHHFDCIRMLPVAVEYEIDKHYRAFRLSPEEENVNIQFYYPILILQGELLEARPTARSVQLTRTKHLQLRSSVIQGTSELTYQTTAAAHAR